jgi:hypothetical protein
MNAFGRIFCSAPLQSLAHEPASKSASGCATGTLAADFELIFFGRKRYNTGFVHHVKQNPH